MKDLFRMLIIGLAAGACISARQAPDNEEIAMARCSTERDDRCYPGEGRRYENSRRQYYQEDRRRDDSDRRRNERYDERRRNSDDSDRRCYEDERGRTRCDDRGRCPDVRKDGRCYSIDESGRKKCYQGGDNRSYEIEKQRECDERGRCYESTDASEAVQLRNNYKKIVKSSNAVVRKSAAQKILEGVN